MRRNKIHKNYKRMNLERGKTNKFLIVGRVQTSREAPFYGGARKGKSKPLNSDGSMRKWNAARFANETGLNASTSMI